MQASGEPKLEAKAPTKLNRLKRIKYSIHAHNAVFVEVEVDEDLGTTNVARVVNTVATGRILNPKTARSQMLGSMVWGIGMPLIEESMMDHRFGRYMNKSLGKYHAPVNANIHDVDVVFVHEDDNVVNPIGARGIGEVGLIGVAAAVANAIYQATDKHVRGMLITIDKLM